MDGVGLLAVVVEALGQPAQGLHGQGEQRDEDEPGQGGLPVRMPAGGQAGRGRQQDLEERNDAGQCQPVQRGSGQHHAEGAGQGAAVGLGRAQQLAQGFVPGGDAGALRVRGTGRVGGGAVHDQAEVWLGMVACPAVAGRVHWPASWPLCQRRA